MTSWPWMKGIDVAVADPIDAVCPEDDRPAVKDLIQEHAEKIEKIKAGISSHPLYDQSKHDDLWILRFWLSHKKSQAAIEAAKYTLEFRDKYNLDEKDIRDQSPQVLTKGALNDYLQCCSGEDPLVTMRPDSKRGVILFATASQFNSHKLVEEIPQGKWVEVFLCVTEHCHQNVDYTTRTTGRLTKMIRVVDMKGITMSMFNRECSRRDGQAMGVMEDCYPQLLACLFLCHPPAVVKVLWEIGRVLLPKRVVNKCDFINPRDKEKERQHLYRYISEENLPDYLGGNNKLSPSCW